MPIEKFIRAGGFATRIKLYGFEETENDRPALVMLHGYMESLDVWEEFIPLLREYRVAVMDIPGHGISEVKGDVHTMGAMADVAAGMADTLRLEKFYLAGHSMGGYIAAEFLSRYPGRLSGIIMFHSTPNPDTEEKKAHRLREIEIIESGKKDLLAGSVEKGFAAANRKKFSDFIEDLKELVVLTEDRGAVNLLRGMTLRSDRNETFRESGVPQLFIMGRHDEHIPLEVSKKLEETHPQARFAYLDASGHMGYVEEPERSAEIINGFIKETL
ncbi:MAG: alpha/beta hydrolase [Rikenellaceae bacterium]|nr:alpha/beta hydrolase [Rikenellaceae bacterium]